MRWLLAILLLILLAMQIRLWSGEGGRPEVRRLQAAVTEQIEENQRLRERNDQLTAEIEDLRHGLATTEERARSELGMIKEDEIFYQVVEPPVEQDSD